jgi:hypothetical protein
MPDVRAAGEEIIGSNRPSPGVASWLRRPLLREPQLLGAALHVRELPADLRSWMQRREDAHR